MTKKVVKNVEVSESNTALVVNESANRVNNRVKSKADILDNTANSLDKESLKKKEVFDSVKKLFGFELFDENTFAEEKLKSGCTYSELKQAIAKERKRVNSNNENLESLPIAKVCETIVNSSLLSDLSVFLGGENDLVALAEKLVNDKKQVTLYHGTQSENGEKFESLKVSVKGLHKPFEDTCYYSLVDYSVSNLIRGFRNYGYYVASINRCKRLRNEENDRVGTFKSDIKTIHSKFGYSKEDLINIINSTEF